ncbi:hypothetical protein BDQ17DRAFT_1349555 [Cyathus striatus]|nr:hypothetical protein BDQ17DRAFT_1349555 [Cyathus striatus]
MAPSPTRTSLVKTRPSPGASTSSPLRPTRQKRSAHTSISLNVNSYDRTDPFAAFNALIKLLGSLPSRIGGCQFKLTPEEHKVSMHLLSVVEPFVGLAPSRRTMITRQPTEILDAIVFYVNDRQDLLSLALSCKRMHDIVFPRHWDYRVIRCKLSSIRVWNHLSVHRCLARNVRRLEVMDERSTLPELVPKGILSTDTDLESTDDELTLHEKQERFLQRALGRMAGLKAFKWSSNHSPVEIHHIWPILVKLGTLERVEIADNLVFLPNDTEESKLVSKQAVLPHMTSMVLKSTQHIYGASKHPDLSRVSAMLINCPNLENLDVTYVAPRSSQQSGVILRPVADEFLLYNRWPQLTTLKLVNLRCSIPTVAASLAPFLAAHVNIESLHVDFGGETLFSDLPLPSGSLPRLRELCAGKGLLNAIIRCPLESDSVRPLETIKGFKLSGSQSSVRKLDYGILEQLRSLGKQVKRVEMTGWSDMDDIKLLVDAFPGLTWLDIGKKLNSTSRENKHGTAGPVTNMVEWAELLSDLPELATFHGVRFFYEVSCLPGASTSGVSMTDRSRMRKNDEIAGMLAWKCKRLRRVDHWEEGGGRIIVILRDKGLSDTENSKDKSGDLKARWDIRRIRQ